MSLKTHLILSAALAALSLPVAALAQTTATPPAAQLWMNAALDPDARADMVMHVMTTKEKQQLVFGYFSTTAPWMHFTRPDGGLADAAGYIAGIARLGIPAQSETDAGVGVATQRSPHPRLRTSLPSGIATAATWDRDLAFAGGAMIGNEARLSGFNVQLAGGVDLLREPRNGRNFESAGEDPLLAGSIDGQEIRGIQSNNIISTLKHYAFNDQETDRFTVDVKIGDPAARQSDLLAFQLANETGHPGSVMCSYNRVNGAYACESDWLLNQVLKTDWGFKGYVMSDWGATHSTVPAANAGLDQESGYPFDVSPYFKDALGEAVADGWVRSGRLDDMTHRILRSMFAEGLFEHPLNGDQSAGIDYAAHAAATQADEEGAIVLLKNDHRLLPLAKSARSILIIGGHADAGVLSGGGSSQVYPHGGPENGLAISNDGPDGFPGPMVYFPSSPMAGLKKRTQATLTYIDGKDPTAAARAAAKADVVIVFATQWTGESIDAPDLSLPNHQDALIGAVAKANRKTVVVLETGGPVLMPWLNDVGAVLEAWYPGTSGGEAIARVLTGAVDPSGHLPVTFPAGTDQLPRVVVDGDTAKTGHPHTDYDIEGAAVGYKWFDQKGLKPLVPFGYGLSYTGFGWSGLNAKPAGKGVAVSVTVRNTGAVAGHAVTEVYVAAPSGAGWEAPKRLGAFDKTALAAGEGKTLALSVDPRLLATWDEAAHGWKIAAGDYKVMTGTSAADLAPAVTVHLDAMTLDVSGK